MNDPIINGKEVDPRLWELERDILKVSCPDCKKYWFDYEYHSLDGPRLSDYKRHIPNKFFNNLSGKGYECSCGRPYFYGGSINGVFINKRIELLKKHVSEENLVRWKNDPPHP